MNEITRIHIAKTAYDIEVAAKKQLEKYIKSLEMYTQDADVLSDIEIRMTELLGERGVAAGGVISSDDVDAIRKQLGEPHEFADSEGDITVGPDREVNGRRLYRNTDQAVLGGVLSGIASYFGVTPVWVRIIFIVLLFVSFGFGLFVYILLWAIIPPARTAAERLQLEGQSVTLGSIRALNESEDSARSNQLAPTLQRVFAAGLGLLSVIAAISIVVATVWGIIGVVVFDSFHASDNLMGMGEGYTWLAWITFWIIVSGALLLAALFGLIAYAFFARKLTKRMIVSGIVIIVLGITTFATSVGIMATQSWRVSSEAQSAVREVKANLPQGFDKVRSVVIDASTLIDRNTDTYSAYTSIQYVVDSGSPRYELRALPNVKPKITVEGETARIALSTPKDHRNTYVQPELIVYGPALDSLTADGSSVAYRGMTQPALTITSKNRTNISIDGVFGTTTAKGSGTIDLGSGSVGVLSVDAERGLVVMAGTVRELKVTQPDVCPSGTYGEETSVNVTNVTSGVMTYNDKQLPAATHRTNCASVVFEEKDY